MFQCSGISISDWNITRLHRNKLLMRLKIVIFRQHSSSHQFFLQNGYKIKQIFRMATANVVQRIRRNWQTILTCLMLRCTLHYAHYTFNDVIHISEITLTITIVENFNGFASTQLVGETEIRHVRTTSRTIYREEAQTRGRNIIQLRVSMSHKLIALLSSGIQAYWIVYLVLSRERNLLVATIYR